MIYVEDLRFWRFILLRKDNFDKKLWEWKGKCSRGSSKGKRSLWEKILGVNRNNKKVGGENKMFRRIIIGKCWNLKGGFLYYI